MEYEIKQVKFETAQGLIQFNYDKTGIQISF